MKKRVFRETDGIRGKVGQEPLTNKSMYRLGRAIGRYFGTSSRLLIGRDTRESGVWISHAISRGMADVGVEVWDIKEVSTPCVGILTKHEDVSGGVMVTASHNPASDNGVKVFGGDGNKLTDKQELEVERLFFEEGGYKSKEIAVEKNKDGKVISKTGVVKDYIKRVTEDVDLSGWRVCVDSAAGGAWQIAQKAFKKMRAEPTEVGPKPNGKNINDGCGAGLPEGVATKVIQMHADMGVAFDGDADRLTIVDDEGQIWDGDRITAMLAVWLKEEKRLKNNAVVMTEYSNLGAVLWLKEQGIRVEKVLNGDRAVADKCEKIGAVLGGEVAGHIIYPEWMSASDGLFATTLVANVAQKKKIKLSELRPEYKNFPKKIWNVVVKERRSLEEIAGWSDELERQKEILGQEGRVFARYSGTEDLLRILVEAKDERKMEGVGKTLSEFVEARIGR